MVVSMLVSIDQPLVASKKPTEVLAQELLGRIVFVNWPYLTEAKVVKVSDAKQVFERDREPQKNDGKLFGMCCKNITEHYKNRLAINFAKCNQLVHVKTCVGSEYVLEDKRYVLNKLWDVDETMYPVQLVVTDLQEALNTLKPCQEIREIFPANCMVFLRSKEWYGCLGYVIDVTEDHEGIKTRIEIEIHEEPDLREVAVINDNAKSEYLTMQDAAKDIRILPDLLDTLSSSKMFMFKGPRRSENIDRSGKQNIGLQLRMVTADIETVGYTRKDGETWMFSTKAVELVKSYQEKFPRLFQVLKQLEKTDIIFEEEVFGNNDDGEGMKELVAWIKSQDHAKAGKRSCGTVILEPIAVEALVNIVNEQENNLPRIETMCVYPKDLYKPGMKQARSIDHQANLELLDRVIIARETEAVPLGYRGTIIGIYLAKDLNPVRQKSVNDKGDKYLDVLFDKEFPNGIQVFFFFFFLYYRDFQPWAGSSL